MLLKNLLTKLDQSCEEYENEHSFAFNSREEFAIPKQKVEKAIKNLSYDPLTTEECKEILGRKWKVNVKNICILYDFLKHNKFYAEYSPVMISTTLCYTIKSWKTKDGKKVGTPVFKFPSDVERVIQNMIDLKCCKCVDPKYGVDVKKGKIYVLSDSRISSLFDLNKLTFERECICIDNVRDSDIVVDDNDNVKIYELYDRLGLRELVRSVNRRLGKTFQYRMTGWRPSADICYLPSREKTHKRKHDIYREDVIPFEYKEYDRNASIYNLQLFLGKGTIRENDREKYDFYADFSKRLRCIEFGHIIRYDDLNKLTFERECICIDNVNNNSSSVDSNSSNVELEYDSTNLREYVKNLMMSIQFASMKQINALVEDYINYLMTADSRCFKKARKFRDRAKSIVRLLGLESFDLKENEDFVKLSQVFKHFFREAKKLLHEYLGISLGKDVFLYEAAVNLKCQSLIQEAGFDCVTVYDGFYTNCNEEFWWSCYQQALFFLKKLTKTER